MLNESCEAIIDVNTGEVKVSLRPVILRALALGSCVAVMVYDKTNKIGGIAHVMLPGKSLKKVQGEKVKYAIDALDVLFDTVKKLGVDMKNLEVNIIGGANVLGEGDIPDKVIESVLVYLRKLNIEPKKKKIGGIQRRSIFFEIDSGKISYTEGDSDVREL